MGRPASWQAAEAITTEDVLAALKPYWTSRPETGRRMRMRIEAVLDAARAKGLIAAPGRTRRAGRAICSTCSEAVDREVRHHKALPYAEAPGFMAELAQRDAMAAYALRFTILTVARTSEVVYAKWSEIDGDIWTVPAERMKMKREHRVPLPPAALEVLEAVAHPDGVTPDDWIFPSLFRKGRPLSTAAMDRCWTRWASRARRRSTASAARSATGPHDCTNFATRPSRPPWRTRWGMTVERAYRRGDALLKRRKLMEAWAGYLGLCRNRG
jgi:integrase